MNDQDYELYIDVFTPETIPLGRLSEYMARFAALLGNESHVHFDAVVPGSLRVRASVEEIAAPKVRVRMEELRFGKGLKTVLEAFQAIVDLLAADGAVGKISRSEATLIAFPGRQRHVEGLVGPVERKRSAIPSLATERGSRLA